MSFSKSPKAAIQPKNPPNKPAQPEKAPVAPPPNEVGFKRFFEEDENFSNSVFGSEMTSRRNSERPRRSWTIIRTTTRLRRFRELETRLFRLKQPHQKTPLLNQESRQSRLPAIRQHHSTLMSLVLQQLHLSMRLILWPCRMGSCRITRCSPIYPDYRYLVLHICLDTSRDSRLLLSR